MGEGKIVLNPDEYHTYLINDFSKSKTQTETVM